MKRKRFSVEQIVAVLKQAELGMPVVDILRMGGILQPGDHRHSQRHRLTLILPLPRSPAKEIVCQGKKRGESSHRLFNIAK